MSKWICCQIGAREHYAVPRALQKSGELSCLITDTWVKPQSILNLFNHPLLRKFQERYHPGLASASVQDLTSSLIGFELSQQFQKTQGWERIIARNIWFQSHALKKLEQLKNHLESKSGTPIFFGYSYSSLELIRYAKLQGWYTVLGQMDPGIWEERLVQAECQKHPHLVVERQAIPEIYWEPWQKECLLADRIIVNSKWSQQLLEKAGVATSKIEVIPLVYEFPPASANFTRNYPSSFSTERPLKVLFLGLIDIRKGIAALFDTIRLLTGEAVEFWMVGSVNITIPSEFAQHSQVRWIGSVPRSEVHKYYQMADVFIFPTLSDGFGLTQLEAQVWRLPVIASRYCGEVVEDGINGWILPEVSGEAIAEKLLQALQQPQMLQSFAEHSVPPSKFSLSSLAVKLQSLIPN